MVLNLSISLEHFTNFFIVKIDSPPQLAKLHPFVSQPTGSTLFLTCNAILGSKPISFHWYRNGIEIVSNHVDHKSIDQIRYTIDSKQSFSHFSLVDIVREDSANYSCTAQNVFGFDTQWSFLQVKGLIKHDLSSLPKCGAHILAHCFMIPIFIHCFFLWDCPFTHSKWSLSIVVRLFVSTH